MKCFSLLVEGKFCVVSDAKGKEVTRREGFANPSRFCVVFPKIGNDNYSLKGAKILQEKIITIPVLKMELPKPEKNYNPIVRKKTYVENWHSPASINVKTGEIIYNKKFVDSSKAKQLFIYAHEVGHFFYNTEKFCDLYASLILLKSGFGKSQCLEVLRNMLNNSAEKSERYSFVLNELKKLK